MKIRDKNYKFLVLKLAGVLCFSFIAIAPLAAKADNACDPYIQQFDAAGGTVGSSVIKDLPQVCDANTLIYKIITIALAFSAGIAIVFIIIGGYLYLASAGNEEQAEKGRKTIINSIIGLVVIMMAVVIVRIVAQTVQGNVSGSGGGGATPTTKPSRGVETTAPPPTLEQAKKDLAAGIVVPAGVVKGETLKIYAAYDAKKYADSIKEVCGDPSLLGKDLVASFTDPQGGEHTERGSFQGAGTGAFTAEADFSTSAIPANTADVAVSVCGESLGIKHVSITAPVNTPSDSSGNFDNSQSSFMVGASPAGKKYLIVTLNVPLQDMKTMCTTGLTGQMQIWVNNDSVYKAGFPNTQAIVNQSVTVELPASYDAIPPVTVRICGADILQAPGPAKPR